MRDAVAARLAADAAYPLVGANTLMQQMYELFIVRIGDADEASAIEGSSTILQSQRLELLRK